MKGQPTLWPIDDIYGDVTIPEEYPWRYHELVERYKAQLIHPALAAVMAAEDIANEEAAAKRAERLRTPTLFDEAQAVEEQRSLRPRLRVVA
jgi:hypothetical protein